MVSVSLRDRRKGERKYGYHRSANVSDLCTLIRTRRQRSAQMRLCTAARLINLQATVCNSLLSISFLHNFYFILKQDESFPVF